MSESIVSGRHDVPWRGGQRIVLIAAMLALTFSGLVSLAEPVSAASFRTTANLNLREGPGMSFSVVRVIPSGATVDVTGDAQFGFLPVTYSGSVGFASAEFLTSGGGSTTPGSGGGVAVGDSVTGSAATTARLNMRSGPGTSYSVRLTMPNGARVELMGSAQSGFLPVRYNGTKGWAATDYLNTGGGSTPAPSPGSGSGVAVGDTVTGSAATTARLNMRSGPGTSYSVRLTMPNGARVELMGSAQRGFLPVRYNGAKGWASADFLTTGGGSTPAPVPGSGATIDQKVTTAGVNMRSGPSTSNTVVTVLPPGTLVDITGGASNDFLPAKWAGRSGWVHGDFLVDPGSTPDPGSGDASDQEIISIIYAAADRWGQPRADMLRVARCESNLDPAVVNRSSGASGLFQFMPSTFAFTPNGKRGENIFNAYSSADAAGWMWTNGMRNHWACQ